MYENITTQPDFDLKSKNSDFARTRAFHSRRLLIDKMREESFSNKENTIDQKNIDFCIIKMEKLYFSLTKNSQNVINSIENDISEVENALKNLSEEEIIKIYQTKTTFIFSDLILFLLKIQNKVEINLLLKILQICKSLFIVEAELLNKNISHDIFDYLIQNIEQENIEIVKIVL